LKRSILFDAPHEYVGRERILGWWRQARKLDAEKEDNQRELYLVTLWITGARLNEALDLTPEQVSWTDTHITISNMPVLKRQKRVTREVLIRCDELDPLAQVFVELCEKCETQYLLPGRTGLSSEVVDGRHVSPTTVLNKIHEIIDPKIKGGNLWCHLLRDQRAYFLRDVRGFDIFEIRQAFGWSRLTMPIHYLGDPEQASIKRKLGITE
jgi:integrase